MVWFTWDQTSHGISNLWKKHLRFQNITSHSDSEEECYAKINETHFHGELFSKILAYNTYTCCMHQPCSTCAVNSMFGSCIGLNLHTLHCRTMSTEGRAHCSTWINQQLLIRVVIPIWVGLRWQGKPAVTGIWSWTSLYSNDPDQLCDAQASLDKGSTDEGKIQLTKKKKKYRPLKKYHGWYVYIS